MWCVFPFHTDALQSRHLFHATFKLLIVSVLCNLFGIALLCWYYIDYSKNGISNEGIKQSGQPSGLIRGGNERMTWVFYTCLLSFLSRKRIKSCWFNHFPPSTGFGGQRLHHYKSTAQVCHFIQNYYFHHSLLTYLCLAFLLRTTCESFQQFFITFSLLAFLKKDRQNQVDRKSSFHKNKLCWYKIDNLFPLPCFSFLIQEKFFTRTKALLDMDSFFWIWLHWHGSCMVCSILPESILPRDLFLSFFFSCIPFGQYFRNKHHHHHFIQCVSWLWQKWKDRRTNRKSDRGKEMEVKECNFRIVTPFRSLSFDSLFLSLGT